MEIKTEKYTKYYKGFIDSRIGGRAENQDACGYEETKIGLLVVVCDGMGGVAGGKTASFMAVSEIFRGVKESDAQDTPVMILQKAIRRANLSIIQKASEDPSLRGMGTTVTVLLLNEQSAILAHVGDSRIYHFRGKSKVFRTFDHSMVFDLVKQKVITEEQARLSAQSNVINRALGIKAEVEVDITERAYETGDRFLLCTDGVCGVFPEEKLIKLVTEKNFPLVLESLMTKVDAIGNAKGGNHDNLTAALIETKCNSLMKDKMNAKTKKILGIIIGVLLVSITFNIVQMCTKEDTKVDTKTDEKVAIRNEVSVESSLIKLEEQK